MALRAPADHASGPTRRPTEASADVVLLGGFQLRNGGQPVVLPLSGQRLIAFLAVHEQTLQRTFVAGSLWPDVPDERALASLRSVLWRLRDLAPGVVEGHQRVIRLQESIVVDVTHLVRASRETAGLGPSDVGPLAFQFFAGELLPDWYDEWLTEWRERWRQIRLHTLERLARLLTTAGEYELAIDAALAAIRAEPLRESAHRTLIEAHLAEGNASEAIRQFGRYEQLLRTELDIAPSPRMRELMLHVTDE
jgi:DNA-binding SARP family transcriptional activator